MQGLVAGAGGEISTANAHEMMARNSPANRVLFVSNEASRTGSPIMLLNLLRWLSQHSNIDFDLLLRDGGLLIREYQRLCPVYVAGRPSRAARLGSQLMARLKIPPRRWLGGLLLDELATRNIGLIYCNT